MSGLFVAYIFCNSYKMLVVLYINEKYYDVRKKQQISSLPVTDRLRIHFLFTLQERPAMLECSL